MSLRRIRGQRVQIDASLATIPSKSVTHRTLVCAALADGKSRLLHPLEADDTQITARALEALGIGIERSPGCWEVEGRAGLIPGGARLELGESGTSFRFLTAVAALGLQASRMDGSQRLRERPVGGLAPALVELGAYLSMDSGPGLPLDVGGRPLTGRSTTVEASRSSQFASALMLIGPCLPEGLRLSLQPPVISGPYLDLTIQTMGDFGVSVKRESEYAYRIPRARYRPGEHSIEGDYSAASYALAAAAITGGRISFVGLRPDSLQADRRFVEILRAMGVDARTNGDTVTVQGTGAVAAIDIALGDAPDIAPTVAVLALFAEGASTLREVAHLRIKESNRLELLASNLRRLGRPATATEDRLEIGPMPESLHPATIETAGDHRMAMAFAVAGLRLPGLAIDHPDCVAKSYPGFWDDFRHLESGEDRRGEV